MDPHAIEPRIPSGPAHRVVSTFATKLHGLDRLQQLHHAKTQRDFAHARACALQRLTHRGTHTPLQACIQLSRARNPAYFCPKCESIPRACSGFACASALLLPSDLDVNFCATGEEEHAAVGAYCIVFVMLVELVPR
jgi:hypothetical protein